MAGAVEQRRAMTEPKAQVLSAGRAAFSALAPRAGFPSEGWQAVVLSARREGTGARGVLRFDREGFAPLIVKLRLPVDAARSEAARAAHALAAHNLPGGTVRLLAAAPDHGALLLSHVPGRTAWEVLSQTEDSAERIRVLRASGAWLGTFHLAGGALTGGGAKRSAPQSDQPVQTEPPLRRLRRLARQRDIPQAGQYARCLAALSHWAAAIEGQITPAAVIHGDMTLSNLLVEGDTVTGIDFENIAPAPAMRDLASLLVDDAIWFGQGAEGPVEVSAPGIDAYQAQIDVAVLRFYAGVRLLSLWAAQPNEPADRSPRRAYVWDRIQEIAPDFFML